MARITALILINHARDLQRCQTPLNGMVASTILIDPHGTRADAINAKHNLTTALNTALHQISTDWILLLTSDEVISQPSLAKLRTFLDTATHDAYTLPIREFTNTTNSVGWKPSTEVAGYTGYLHHREIRLWKHTPTIQFSGNQKPSILPSLTGSRIAAINDIRIHAYPRDTTTDITNLVTAYKNKPTDTATAYELGIALMHKQNWKEARDIFLELSKHHALYRNTLVNLGICKLHTGNTVGAARAFVSALKDNPRDVLAMNNLAAVFYMAGKYDKAEQWYQRALTHDRKDPRLIKALSDTYLKLGKKAESERLLAMGRKMHPKNPLLH